MRKLVYVLLLGVLPFVLAAQINTNRVLAIGRNALYFEDYVLSIQYFNQVINSKPWLAEPYFYRAVAKLNLDDYKGAESDCSLCLERNPFLVQTYYARGIARQSMDNYDGAIADYKKGLEFKAEDRRMLMNMAIANIQKKDYEEAEKTFEVLIDAFPRISDGYLARGAMYTEKGDTAKALADYNKAIDVDAYFAPAYGNRALLYYQMNKMKEALKDLNMAIHLDTRESGFYINRGLVKYQLNDLRGAMADYDQVVEMDSRNCVARFNRGLLRTQIGDGNRAIEDFDAVIQLEPENYIAYYNRALLRYETGNYKGAVNDMNVVLKQYPHFIPGYYSRAEAKRKMQDEAGADRDYWTAMNMQQQHKKKSTIVSADTLAVDDEQDNEEVADKTKRDTREQSDQNIEKFNNLVVYDKEEEQKSKYHSDIRGRVQDRNVKVDLEPMFVLTYYEKVDRVKTLVYYNRMVEDYNNRMVLNGKLRITNQEAALTEAQVNYHFKSIDDYSAKIERDINDADAFFGRAIDFMLVQDFAEAIKNYTYAIERNSNFAMAYFNRAIVRYKQLDYNLSLEDKARDDFSVMTLSFGKNNTSKVVRSDKYDGFTKTDDMQLKENKKAYEYEQIMLDYDMVIRLNPDFVYAYYNRGNLHCLQRDYRAAIKDYTDAIDRNPDFAEAYFNRGLAKLSQGDANSGVADLSKAGELGLYNAYSIIKRMTTK